MNKSIENIIIILLLIIIGYYSFSIFKQYNTSKEEMRDISGVLNLVEKDFTSYIGGINSLQIKNKKNFIEDLEKNVNNYNFNIGKLYALVDIKNKEDVLINYKTGEVLIKKNLKNQDVFLEDIKNKEKGYFEDNKIVKNITVKGISDGFITYSLQF